MSKNNKAEKDAAVSVRQLAELATFAGSGQDGDGQSQGLGGQV